MNQLPSSIKMAQELINSKPGLFKNDYATLLTLADAMIDFKNKCDQFISENSGN